jgi:hypothetical protein
MANRSMDAKYKRAVSQRQALGEAEGSKPAYHTNKPLLRLIASNAQHMVRNVTPCKAAWSEPLTVLYNPSIYRAPKSLAVRCMVACDGELIRKADYFRR